MSHTFTIPRGFHSTCEQLNTIASTDDVVYSAIVDVIYNLLTLPNPTASTPILPPVLQSCSSFSTSELESALNVMQHILFYVHKQFKQDNDAIKSFLQSKTILTPEAITQLLDQYTKLSQNVVTFDDKSITKQQTINVQWKIGLIVSSSNCQQIYSPYVSLSIDVASQYQSFEMNLSEFSQFANTIHEIQQALKD